MLQAEQNITNAALADVAGIGGLDAGFLIDYFANDDVIDKIEKKMEEALQLRREHYSGTTRDKEIAPSYISLAKLHVAFGDHQKALEYSRRAKDAYTKGFGPRHPKVLNAYEHIVHNLLEMQQYELASQNLARAIEIEKAQEDQAQRHGRWDEFTRRIDEASGLEAAAAVQRVAIIRLV